MTRQRIYAENLEAPPDKFLPWAVYKKRFGALGKHAGHQRRRINGIDGVVIPADEAEGWKLQRVYGSSVNKDTTRQTDIASVAHAPGSTGACGVPCTVYCLDGEPPHTPRFNRSRWGQSYNVMPGRVPLLAYRGLCRTPSSINRTMNQELTPMMRMQSLMIS